MAETIRDTATLLANLPDQTLQEVNPEDVRDVVVSGMNRLDDIVGQAEAEGGSSTTVKLWTAERVNQAIQALSPAGTGETNTASNQGAGVGVFDEKTGVDLEFRSLIAVSSKITIGLDDPNDEIDFDVDETAIDHDNLLNFVAGEHVLHSGVNLAAGVGLTGGGDITLSRTFDFDLPGLTVETAIDEVNDVVAFFDDGAAAHRKITLANLMQNKLDLGGGTMTGTLTLSGDGTGSLDAVTKQQLDAVEAGVDQKDPCDIATTANITLSGEQTLDGVLTSASRVLVKDQTAGEENGIYTSAAGAWTRTTDADENAEVTQGLSTLVLAGTTQTSTSWMITTPDPIVVGTTSISFVQFAGPNDVTSVFTRTGAVVATASDYDASLVDNDSGVTGAFVDDALNTLDSLKADAAIDLTAGRGIAGGGTLAANRTFDIDIFNEADKATPIGTDEVIIENTTGGTVNSVTLTNLSKAIDHDQTVNFLADEHIAHTGVTITAGSGLAGTANIAASFTLDVDITSETENASPATNDFVLVENNAGGTFRKVQLSNLPSGGASIVDSFESVELATTANVTLSGEQTIDGISTSTSRILVKDQTAGAENGIYDTAAGAWTRATDMDTDAELTQGARVFVATGTAGSATAWIVTTADPITIGTTATVWSEVGPSASGEANLGADVGVNGVPVFRDKTSVTLNFHGVFGLAAGGVDAVLNDPNDDIELSLDIFNMTVNASPASTDVFATENAAGGTLRKVALSSIDHDTLTGFVANEHIDHTSVTITAGSGLAGTSDISSSFTLDVDIAGEANKVTPLGTDEVILQATAAGAINKATLTNLSKGIDHDQTVNFAADEHVAHAGVTITAGSGLAGTSNISSSFTLDADIFGEADKVTPIGSDIVLIESTAGGTFNKASLTNVSKAIDHDQTANFLADEHIAHSTVTITSGRGLAGGSSIDASFTLNIDIFNEADKATPIGTDEVIIENTTGGTTNSVTLTNLSKAIDHDQTANFLSDEHVAHTGVTITAGTGLTGTSNIAASFTLDVDIGGTADKATPLSTDEVLLQATASGTINKATLSNLGKAIVQGRETIFVPANAMWNSTTAGAADLAKLELSSGKDIFTYNYDQTTEESVQFKITMPNKWDAGTVIFQVTWTQAGAVTTGVAWGLQAFSTADNETLDGTYGTQVIIQDDAQGAAHELNITAESTAVTITGAAKGEQVTFKLARIVGDANDDLAEDAKLIGCRVFYTTDANTDD